MSATPCIANVNQATNMEMLMFMERPASINTETPDVCQTVAAIGYHCVNVLIGTGSTMSFSLR